MKILYYFRNLASYMFQWQKSHIFDEMSTHGCQFTIVSPDDFNNISEANLAILNMLKNTAFDLFMTCLSDAFFTDAFFTELKKTGIKSLLFCPDNLVVPFNHKKICKAFDLVWLTSKETDYLFKKWGAKTLFLPYAANPNLCSFAKTNQLIRRIVFVGTPHGSRVRIINFLLKNRIPVTIYTSKANTDKKFWKASFWKYFASFIKQLRYPIGFKLAISSFFDKISRPRINVNSEYLEICDPVPPDQLSKIYSNYSLVLSFTEANSTGVLKKPVDIVNLRNFEIPMSGAVQICRFTKEISEYFPNGKAAVLYKNKKDFLTKAKHYLSEEATLEIEEMRINARALSENKHTWYKRFSTVLEKLFDGIEL